ncbi:NAD(P)H-flavin reductase [Saccharobesus litoralis]|uniref:NAD(P)H-flavin reductase n=1 Tax=Saccharobesus litoralis TaxID=2172099 RepID=A0A2S0VRC8_9ALTE|nr:NAD(P)H-flavin reductase [Saccharobesus litoralis]AWB66640.1 NAD(P)H-flavin reductase [Saccharobesus litoralis]
MQAIQTQVISISPLTPFVYKVLLKPQTNLAYAAGQYLMLVLGEEDKRAFSIANAPIQFEKSGLLELHIGAGNEDGYAMGAVKHLQDALDNDQTVVIEAAGGNAQLRSGSSRPVLLVAGGTGFTYTKAIAEELLEEDATQPITFYWGVRSEDALYELEHWQALHNAHPNFNFIPVVDNAPSHWQGKSGNLLEAVMNDVESFAEYDVYCAGRFEMVGKAREMFLEKGLVREQMFGDAFAFIK